MLKQLIGAELVSLNKKQIVIKKNNNTYVLDIVEDEGDCCGFNKISAKLLINNKKLGYPVITNIKKEKNDCGDAEVCSITFFGLNKPIAKINSLSSSDSGYTYGACVMIKCKPLKINEILTEW